MIMPCTQTHANTLNEMVTKRPKRPKCPKCLAKGYYRRFNTDFHASALELLRSRQRLRSSTDRPSAFTTPVREGHAVAMPSTPHILMLDFLKRLVAPGWALTLAFSLRLQDMWNVERKASWHTRSAVAMSCQRVQRYLATNTLLKKKNEARCKGGC